MTSLTDLRAQIQAWVMTATGLAETAVRFTEDSTTAPPVPYLLLQVSAWSAKHPAILAPVTEVLSQAESLVATQDGTDPTGSLGSLQIHSQTGEVTVTCQAFAATPEQACDLLITLPVWSSLATSVLTQWDLVPSAFSTITTDLLEDPASTPRAVMEATLLTTLRREVDPGLIAQTELFGDFG